METPGLALGSQRTAPGPGGSRSVTARFTLRSMTLGSSNKEMRPASEADDLDILCTGSCRSMMRAPPPGRGYGGLGHGEGVAIAGVPTLGQVAGELQVLALVVADRHEVGLVQQDVGRHQHRVGEQARAGRIPRRPLPDLVLELGHAGKLAHAGGALEEPGQLGMLMDVALDEQRATLRVQPGRHEQGRHA